MTQDLWLAKLVCFTKQNIVACLKVHEAVCCLLNARVWCFFLVMYIVSGMFVSL